MITTIEVKIKRDEEFSSRYIEEELKKKGLDVLRWAVTGVEGDSFIINAAIVKD